MDGIKYKLKGKGEMKMKTKTKTIEDIQDEQVLLAILVERNNMIINLHAEASEILKEKGKIDQENAKLKKQIEELTKKEE